LGSTIIFSTLFIVCLASSICLQIFVPAFVGPWLCVDVDVLWGRICSGFSGLANLTTKFTLLFSLPSDLNRIVRSTDNYITRLALSIVRDLLHAVCHRPLFLARSTLLPIRLRIVKINGGSSTLQHSSNFPKAYVVYPESNGLCGGTE
jgi:hypothetical protein